MISFSHLRALFFKPDVTVTADPSSPDPSQIAEGVALAFAAALKEASEKKLLVSRVPGSAVAIGLSSVARKCTVSVVNPDGSEKTAERGLPPFTSGAEESLFMLAAETDDLRLAISPTFPLASYRRV